MALGTQLDLTKQFTDSLSAFTKRQKIGIQARVKGVVRSIHNDCIQLTPVKTGRAQSNWKVSVGTPDMTESGVGTTTPITTAKATQSSLSGLTLPAQIFITNAVPYIGYLENGTPRIQASRMMATALQKAQNAGHIEISDEDVKA